MAKKKKRNPSKVRLTAEAKARKRGVSEEQIAKSRKAAGIKPAGASKPPSRAVDRLEQEEMSGVRRGRKRK